MCGSMVDIQSAAAKISRGEKKIEDRRQKPLCKNTMSTSATQGRHKNYSEVSLDRIEDETTKYHLVLLIFCVDCNPYKVSNYFVSLSCRKKQILLLLSYWYNLVLMHEYCN